MLLAHRDIVLKALRCAHRRGNGLVQGHVLVHPGGVHANNLDQGRPEVGHELTRAVLRGEGKITQGVKLIRLLSGTLSDLLQFLADRFPALIPGRHRVIVSSLGKKNVTSRVDLEFIIRDCREIRPVEGVDDLTKTGILQGRRQVGFAHVLQKIERPALELNRDLSDGDILPGFNPRGNALDYFRWGNDPAGRLLGFLLRRGDTGRLSRSAALNFKIGLLGFDLQGRGHLDSHPARVVPADSPCGRDFL